MKWFQVGSSWMSSAALQLLSLEVLFVWLCEPGFGVPLTRWISEG